MIALSVALAAVATSCAVPQTEAAMQATLSYEAFDNREDSYGWRSLNAAGCTEAALSLLATYLSTNETRLTDEQRLELIFHAGQSLAFAARESEAVPYFERAADAKAPPEWRTYVAATLAFLKHDVIGLTAAREAYAAIAPGSMRLNIIDGFIACPNASYTKAVHCKM
jgi:hypothetical protein